MVYYYKSYGLLLIQLLFIVAEIMVYYFESYVGLLVSQ